MRLEFSLCKHSVFTCIILFPTTHKPLDFKKSRNDHFSFSFTTDGAGRGLYSVELENDEHEILRLT